MAVRYVLLISWILSLVFTAVGVYNIIEYRTFTKMSSDKARAVKYIAGAVGWISLAIIMVVIGFNL